MLVRQNLMETTLVMLIPLKHLHLVIQLEEGIRKILEKCLMSSKTKRIHFLDLYCHQRFVSWCISLMTVVGASFVFSCKQFRNSILHFLILSQAKNIVKNLWENEVELCSFITDMQQQGFGKKAGHCIFFLETILVPPIKFRLPSKGSDSVSFSYLEDNFLLLKVIEEFL